MLNRLQLTLGVRINYDRKKFYETCPRNKKLNKKGKGKGQSIQNQLKRHLDIQDNDVQHNDIQLMAFGIMTFGILKFSK